MSALQGGQGYVRGQGELVLRRSPEGLPLPPSDRPGQGGPGRFDRDLVGGRRADR